MSARDRYWAADRMIEAAGILTVVVLTLHLLAQVADSRHPGWWWIVGTAAGAGYLAADLVSGIVHWVFDTFGSGDTPVIGRRFIAPFREHHRDAQSITRHGFLETNGNNCLGALAVLGPACAIPVQTGAGLFTLTFLLVTSLGLVGTNQIHKWAHVDRPPRLVRALQRWHLILSGDHHQMHHAAPYATHYCITSGWLNPILRAVDFHRRLERGIHACCGRTVRGGGPPR